MQQPSLTRNDPSTRNDKLNADLFQKKAELTRSASASDYKIGPDDLLDIDVFQVPELKTSVRVSSSGYIKLPIGDPVEAKGYTASELEGLLAGKLNKYLNEPMVTVFIKEYRSQQISVLGYVKTPGIYFVSGQKSLLDLLSLAGGLTPDGGDVCVIQRASADETDGKKKIENIVIDLDELLTNGRAELNIPVCSGDIIHVPKAGVFFVDGAVGGPGLYPLKGKVTLMQALSMAKGLNWEAARSNISIYRDNGQSKRELLTVDYDDIVDKKIPDVELKDKDLIIVNKNGLKNLAKGVAATLNFGMFSLGKGY